MNWIYTYLLYIYIYIFAVNIYIYIYVLNKIHILHVEPVSYIYIYIYTQPATLASKYILRIIYIYNYKCKMLASRTRDFKYILSATFWTFYERALAENTFPPLPSQLLQNFPLPRIKLSVCTSSRETKISGIMIFSTFCSIFCVLVLLLWLLVL